MNEKKERTNKNMLIQSNNEWIIQSLDQSINQSINGATTTFIGNKLPGIKYDQTYDRHLAEEPGADVCTNAPGAPEVPGTFVNTFITGAFMKGVLGLSKGWARLDSTSTGLGQSEESEQNAGVYII